MFPAAPAAPFARNVACREILVISFLCLQDLSRLVNSLAENKFDLELRFKVFFFTEFCSVDIAFEESE